jgi:NADH dehydrogenase/NADH:ubiquinone oxidoreductase subunit G
VRLRYQFPVLKVDTSHERFGMDQNRCVLCMRCVRVCDEVEGAHTWDVAGRGSKSHVVSDLDEPWGESESCTGCGKCVQVCPTGALFAKGKSVAEMRKDRGFLEVHCSRQGETSMGAVSKKAVWPQCGWADVSDVTCRFWIWTRRFCSISRSGLSCALRGHRLQRRWK